MNLDPIDSLRLMLTDRFNLICCLLGSIVMSIWIGFIIVTLVLIEIRDRLPVDGVSPS